MAQTNAANLPVCFPRSFDEPEQEEVEGQGKGFIKPEVVLHNYILIRFFLSEG